MSKRGSVWICIIVIIATMFYGLTPMVAEQDSVYRTYAPLVEVDALIRSEFVAPVHKSRVVDGAIRGMMMALDPYSGYVSPDQMPAFRRRNIGEYVGIGVEVGMIGQQVTVIAPIENGPAMAAGIRAGDALLEINGQPTKDRSTFDVEGMLVGEPHSRVVIRLRRSTGDLVEVEVARKKVLQPTIKGIRRNSEGEWDFWIDRHEHIAYMRISEFALSTIEDFDSVARLLTRQSVAGLVLDLRFNPGGLFTQAVALLDRFIDHGTLVSTVTRRRAIQTYTATPEQTALPVPMAVLVNHGSGSASEITAGSLQDHHRAVIVGERSFGKGSVQNFIELQDGEAGIKLTVALYQLPGGRFIHKTPANAATGEWGVTPDVVISLGETERVALFERLTEQVLTATIDSESASADDDGPERTVMDLIGDDRQLRAAVEEVRARLRKL